MTSMTFPPRSALACVHRVHPKIIITGAAPSTLEESLMHCINVSASPSGSVIKFVSRADEADAFLSCNVQATILSADADNTPLTYLYLMRFDLLAPVKNTADGELYSIWASAGVGCTEADKLHQDLVEICGKQCEALIQSLKECR